MPITLIVNYTKRHEETKENINVALPGLKYEVNSIINKHWQN